MRGGGSYCGKQSCPGRLNRGIRLSACSLALRTQQAGPARPARYKSSSTLVGDRRRSSVFDGERTCAAVRETAKISENSEMSEIVYLDSTLTVLRRDDFG